MYFWNSYPFARLSLVLIAGIFAFERFQQIWIHFNLILGTFIILLAGALALSKKVGHYKLRVVNGLFSIAIIFLLGGQLVHTKYADLPSNHYSQFNSSVKGFSGKIVGPASVRTNHVRYDFETKNLLINDSIKSTVGRLHLYIRKDSNQIIFKYGDLLHIRGSIYPISAPGNPYEFDFKKYLKLQNIHGHAFVQSQHVKKTGHHPPNVVLDYAYKTQSKASHIIDKHIPAPRENGIAKALLIGIKDHLDNEVRKSYSSAGAMHVLAVSGLHVGIVYLFLQYLLGRLKRTKLGRLLFGILSIVVIWSYALITGLSPSVLRAATMFSIVALGEINATRGNIYNSLGLAAFVLLIYDPHLIYSVGFQLSFSAVLGIVYLQPKIYDLVEFNFVIFDKAWAITCVSIAAQIATFPLTAYYFHQFPTYFLVSNLVVIPSATLMLVSGISMLLLDPFLSDLSHLFGWLLSKLIWFVNESVAVVESLPNSLINWIYLDLAGLILTYAIVVSLIWGLHHKSFKTIIISVALFAIFLGEKVSSFYAQSLKSQIIFYEVSSSTAIDHIDGHHAKLYVKENVENLELLSHQINPNRLASGLSPIKQTIVDFNSSHQFEINSPFTFGLLGNKKILFVDSTTFHLQFDQIIETDVLIIENGSIKNLNWLKEHFRFEHLLIGNENSRFYSTKMKRQAASFNIPIHSLIEDGAFILDVRK